MDSTQARWHRRHRGRRGLGGLAVFSVALGVGLGCGTGVAFASQTSAVFNYTTAGTQFQNDESIFPGVEGSYATAANVWTKSGANEPYGYMGASTDLDKSDGTLVARSGWDYNSYATNFFSNTVSDYPAAGWYYGLGATESWNGTGYDSYYTYRTANDWWNG